MRIVVWGINYAPEQTGIAPYNTGLCEYLRSQGHHARMLTTFAYYPEWRKSAADRGRLHRTDLCNGVPVHRCWHYVPRRPKAWQRMLHEATFVLTSSLRLLVLPRADVYLVISPPLLLGLAAAIIGRLRRTPFVFHVQDMQPDAAVQLGLLRPGMLTRVLYFLERRAYRSAALVSGITPGMLAMFSRKGVAPERQVLFPNWSPDDDGAVVEPGAFRRRHGLDSSTLIAAYSGNLGRKQGLDVLLAAAGKLRDADVRIVIAGDGVEKAALAERVQRENLSKVLLLPLQSREHYRELLADADVCLVTQQPGSGALFFPSKLLTILARGRPVLAVADPGGDLERALHEGGFGWAVPPQAADTLADRLRQLSGAREELARAASAGRKWVTQFERPRVLGAFLSQLERRFGGAEVKGRAGAMKSGSER